MEGTKLNFGCSRNIRGGWVNADIQTHPKITSFDFNTFPYPFKKDTFDYILVERVLVFLDNPYRVLDELHRVGKENAIIKIVEPYYNSSGAFNDFSCKHFINERTFKLLVEDRYTLNKEVKFKILTLNLIPTRLGRLIYPKHLRKIASYIFGEIIKEIQVELKIIK